jgi:hypothetical protein
VHAFTEVLGLGIAPRTSLWTCPPVNECARWTTRKPE